MKITLESLRKIVDETVSEAKKRAKKAAEERVVHPAGYQSSGVHDYSQPLGDKNVLKIQGANPGFGPVTDAPASSNEKYIQPKSAAADDDKGMRGKRKDEELLRSTISGMVSEDVEQDPWGLLDEAVFPQVEGSAWESVVEMVCKKVKQ